MSRKLRRLIIPRDVTIFYWGQKIDNNMPLTRQQDANEYTAVVTDLKESVKFLRQRRGLHHFPEPHDHAGTAAMLTKLASAMSTCRRTTTTGHPRQGRGSERPKTEADRPGHQPDGSTSASKLKPAAT